jgi:deoxycytidylate deaminase
LKDLFKNNIGVVARTEINGQEVFGVNSESPNYSSTDYKAAIKLRGELICKYPRIMSTENIGQWPNDALFHAETTALLRAAEKNGGTLAGQSLEVYVDEPPCPHCKRILRYVALELGNPTVTFVDPKGGRFAVRDGARVRPR